MYLKILGEILFAPVDLVQDMFFGIIGIGMFAVCGGLILANRMKSQSLPPRTGDHTAAVIQGFLSLFCALVLLFDLSLAYLDSEEFDDEASV